MGTRDRNAAAWLRFEALADELAALREGPAYARAAPARDLDLRTV
jgi:hypothetical protein